MSKFNFSKPSGESRLDETIKATMSKEEIHRYNINMPKSLFKQLKRIALEEDTTVNALIINALNKVY